MFTAGVDVGSTTAKAVIYKDGAIVSWALIPTGWSPREAGREVLAKAIKNAGIERSDIKRIIGTGYGRVSLDFIDKAITEISCHAKGANYFQPKNRLVIDIGGQDSKAIHINEQGKVLDFIMNDKCAAGTGRFLQVTINSLGLEFDDLNDLPPAEPVAINSMCTVFAESEVISLLAAGTPKESIVAGLYQSVARRVANMAGSLKVPGGVTFTGGVAQSPQMLDALIKELGVKIFVAPHPQLTGALGAAILGSEL